MTNPKKQNISVLWSWNLQQDQKFTFLFLGYLQANKARKRPSLTLLSYL